MKGVPDDGNDAGRFVRGLTLGAIVGAILAGSSLLDRAWSRRKRKPGATPVQRVAPGPGAGSGSDDPGADR